MEERERMCVCMCVCTCAMDGRKSVCECVWKRECVCVKLRDCVCVEERERGVRVEERERKKNIHNALLNRRRSFSAASGREKPI